jgi:hypothetical protein
MTNNKSKTLEQRDDNRFIADYKPQRIIPSLYYTLVYIIFIIGRNDQKAIQLNSFL